MIITRLKQNCKGFTLVELLVALMVTSIVLTAVATLAYALGAANDTSDDTSQKQAQVRFATLRISELIKYSKLVYANSESEIVLWLDDNKNEQLDGTELVVIKKVNLGNGDAQLYEFSSAPEPVVLIPRCSNLEYVLDTAAPQTRFVSISFDLVENGVTHSYQICAGLRSWAEHLLDGSGFIVSDDD
jgi:prepilin-type N-terminal cleavage/methylation domain-containing protein